MKRLLQNIIAFILLGFYLTGFCGIHFIKHSCYSCEHSEIHLTIDADCSDSVDCHCCCSQHAHNKKHHPEENISHSKLCCDYDLVYLKTNPNTILSETSKAPLAMETILLFSNIFSTYSNTTAFLHKCSYPDDYPDDYLQVDRNKLCTFIC
jgi:uncharacterized lipoprotein YehR (DUF1307 family)